MSNTQDTALKSFYDGYYTDVVATKRIIAAVQSVDHLQTLAGNSLGSLLDVGSGEGAVLQEISRRGLATSMDAVEISARPDRMVATARMTESTASSRLATELLK